MYIVQFTLSNVHRVVESTYCNEYSVRYTPFNKQSATCTYSWPRVKKKRFVEINNFTRKMGANPDIKKADGDTWLYLNQTYL